MQTEIRSEQGRPTLYIDGVRTPPVFYGLSDIPASASDTAQAQRNIAAFAKAGISVVNIDTALSIGWHKVTEYQPDAVLAEIGHVLEVHPQAKILMRLHLNPPYWWLRDHPEECIRYRTPEGDRNGIDDGEQDRLIANDFAGHMRVSLASSLWLEEAGEILVKLCQALKSSSEGQSLMGIQVACGGYGEWHQWGTDVSPAMRCRFVRYLKETYPDPSALCRAWGKDVTFESAEFSPQVWQAGDHGFFRDPKRSQPIIDAQRCIQSTAPEAILHFCKIIKTHLPHVLCGAFYGYYFGYGKGVNISGHLETEQLYLAKGVLDFLCGPFCYLKNRDAQGVPMQRGLLESARLHGLLWLTEMDQHPEHIPALGGDPSKKDSAHATLFRNVLQPLVAGQGLWYYDHRVIPQFVKEDPNFARSASIYYKQGWWEAEDLQQSIAQLQKIACRMQNTPYRPAADVLLVYDPRSFYPVSNPYQGDYALIEAVARCGVAYDSIGISELPLVELDRYRCVIMAQTYVLSEAERRSYRKLLQNIPTLWIYACGYCDGSALSVRSLSQTAGMEIAECETASYITVNGQTIPIPENAFSPLFAVTDPQAEALGYYDHGGIAFAKKGKDLWLGLPLPTREWLAPWFDQCGVHRYVTTGDPVLCGGGIVAVNIQTPGKLTVTLKNQTSVVLDPPTVTTAVLDSETGEILHL